MARRIGGTFRNEEFSVECPVCGGEFEFDTDPGASIVEGGGDGTGFVPGDPIVQAKRTTKKNVVVKSSRPRMEGEVETGPPEPVEITCTECGAAFSIDVDPSIQEAEIECPACSAILTVDTGNVGDDPGSDEVIVAYRQGVKAERRRMTLLDERAKTFPQYASAIEGFKRNGSSVESANNWIFQAMAAKPDQGNPGYIAAARRDAAPLNRLGATGRVDGKTAAVASGDQSLAERRGTFKNG